MAIAGAAFRVAAPRFSKGVDTDGGDALYEEEGGLLGLGQPVVS